MLHYQAYGSSITCVVHGRCVGVYPLEAGARPGKALQAQAGLTPCALPCPDTIMCVKPGRPTCQVMASSSARTMWALPE